jgi:murein DD-endopeptidase MepM/ murein hydrolase activator NlpD
MAMRSKASTWAAGLVLGVGILVAPAVLMVMVLTGARTELSAGGGCSEEVAMVADVASAAGLGRDQLANAATIVSVGRRMQVPDRGIVVALATAHQESRFLNYANDGAGSDLLPIQRGIDRSLRLPHQAVGSDHGSLGVFQQQWPWWGTMRELMDPGTAAVKFYARLLAVSGWQAMPVTQAAQAVQHSAYPDAYRDDEGLAWQLLGDSAVGSGNVATAAWTGEGGGASCTQQAAYTGMVVMPLPATARFTDLHNFGAHGGRWANAHTGTDFSTACGTPVLAAHAGTIVIKTDEPWSGPWLVQVTTGQGSLTTWYGHMQVLDVVDGQAVRAGQQIGEVGSLGNASGCHLHFEVHPTGGSIYEDGVDPSKWLQTYAGTQIQTVAAPTGGFVLATFNVLGHSHTRPGGNRPGWAPSDVRMRWAVELLDSYAVEVVGFQEFQPPQRRTLLAIAGDRYSVYSPPGDTVNSIAWRRDRWALVSADTFPIPYFNGHLRDMPIVRLRSLANGRDAIFVNVHNPADPPRFGYQGEFRAEAIRREVGVIRSLVANYDVPIYLTGDFNDRAKAFCALTEGGILTASAGGSNASRCLPPNRAQVDWVFASSRSSWLGHSVVRPGVEGRISDHPLIVARVTEASAGFGGAGP